MATRWSGYYSRIALRGVCRKLTIRGGVSISHASCLPCHVDLIDTTSCSNLCMLMLYCLMAHSIVISRRSTMRVTGTGNWQAAPFTDRFGTMRRIVPPRRLSISMRRERTTGPNKRRLESFDAVRRHPEASRANEATQNCPTAGCHPAPPRTIRRCRLEPLRTVLKTSGGHPAKPSRAIPIHETTRPSFSVMKSLNCDKLMTKFSSEHITVITVCRQISV